MDSRTGTEDLPERGKADDTSPGQLLNAAQRRALSAGLARLEREIEEVEFYLVQVERGGPETGWRRDLDEQETAAVRAALTRIREQLEDLRATFRLPGERRSLRALVSSLGNHLAVVLPDLRSERLARYGPVDAALSEWLDPRLTALWREATLLSRLCRRGASGEKKNVQGEG